MGDNVADRWDIAWALHEAGIPAEQACPGDQARRRVGHGRLAGVVVEDGDADVLAGAVQPDGDSGEIPFVLAVSRTTDPASVVARVRALLQTSWSSEPR